MTKTKQLVLAANFVALGVLLPLFTTHIIGGAQISMMLLPMHIPVLLCGFICGWGWGALCGVLSPVLSSLITGMPPAWPVLPMMIAELAVYGAVSGLFYKKLKLPIYVSLPVAMVAGRAVYGLAFVILIALNPELMLTGVWAAVVTGLPGIAIQLFILPVILGTLPRTSKPRETK